MAKSRKVSRRQRKIAGRSVSHCVVYRMPKMPRSVESLSPEVELRLRCVQHALATRVAAAAHLFHRSLATVYRWVKAYIADGVRGLTPKGASGQSSPPMASGSTSIVSAWWTPAWPSLRMLLPILGWPSSPR